MADHLIDCRACGGAGELHRNRSWRNDPQYDESTTCRVCQGDGVVDFADELAPDVDPEYVEA